MDVKRITRTVEYKIPHGAATVTHFQFQLKDDIVREFTLTEIHLTVKPELETGMVLKGTMPPGFKGARYTPLGIEPL